MSPRAAIPTHTLDVIDNLSRDNTTTEKTLCNVFGILLEEDEQGDFAYWYLGDERCYKGLKIKLCGKLSEYPKVKHGDIVRIHRLKFDKFIKMPVSIAPRNVVVWPAFAYNPTPVTSAMSPTIVDEDIERRRTLESFYCSRISKAAEITQAHQRRLSTSNGSSFFDVAGRIEQISVGKYKEYLITINDGTGSIVVRVFPKNPEVAFESDVHYKVAAQLMQGDYIAALVVKLAKDGGKLDLSANTNYGRALRIVEKSSILGVTLQQSLGELRRSPRLQKQSSQNITSTSQNQTPVAPHASQTSHTSQASQTSQNSQNSIERPFYPRQEPLPSYTRLSEIEKKAASFSYDFYDIIYDGSKLPYACYKSEIIPDYMSDCAVIIVYSPKNQNDSRKHVEVVEKLNDGDLVYIKNIKASWKDGRLKLEMNANTSHGKSIEVIERHSSFGIHLLDTVINPVDDIEEVFYSPANSDVEIEAESPRESI